MKLNQRGGTLITVLLVVLVFSVLGFAVMGNVISENKRTITTETNMQARYLAESGLTYFEKEFEANFASDLKEYLQGLPANTLRELSEADILKYCKDNIFPTLLNNYNKEVGSEKINIKASQEGDRIKVTSTAVAGESEETLLGYYEPSFNVDIDKKIYEFADFTAGGRAIDFTKLGLLNLGLADILNLEVLNPPGNDKSFYPVPDDTILSADVGALLEIFIPFSDSFKTMEDYPVIATRAGSILGANLLADTVRLNVADYQNPKNTNVIIHGGNDILNVASIVRGKYYQDINFKKLAVMGNTVIKQERWGNVELLHNLGLLSGLLDGLGVNSLLDNLVTLLGFSMDRASERTFSFEDSLFVNKSLTIGSRRQRDVKFLFIKIRTDYEEPSNLKIRGNIGVMENLKITDVNLDIGEKDTDQAIYVKGDAKINNAYVNENGNKQNDYYDFRIFAKGKVTFDNRGNSNCNKYNGIFYGENGVEFITEGNNKITINGAIIGNIINKKKVIYNPDPDLIANYISSHTQLIPKGRSFE